ncbi:MAG: hypothetical protein ACOX7B_09805 [Christensenellales bacterium]|jgi:hypothetical protein
MRLLMMLEESRMTSLASSVPSEQTCILAGDNSTTLDTRRNQVCVLNHPTYSTESTVADLGNDISPQFETANQPVEKVMQRLKETQYRNNDTEYNAEIEKAVGLLSRALREFSFDEGSVSHAEKLVLSLSEEKSLRFLGEVVQRIYLSNNDDITVLEGLCVSLERFSNEEVMPWGLTMLMGLLNHKNLKVKESAIRLVDNWVSTNLLSVLKNLDCKSVWMQDYINAVVKRLEETNAPS